MAIEKYNVNNCNIRTKLNGYELYIYYNGAFLHSIISKLGTENTRYGRLDKTIFKQMVNISELPLQEMYIKNTILRFKSIANK